MIKSRASEPLVLRFHPSEKIFHAINAFSWIFLLSTGLMAKFGGLPPEQAAKLMHYHIAIAVLFTVNVLGFILLAPDRFMVILQSLLIWDKNSFLWFKNIGNYPRKVFGIPFGPDYVPPQGRYNGGQKPVYLLFLFMQMAMLASGWIIYLLVPAVAKIGIYWLYHVHLWGGLITSFIVFGIHVPAALVNWELFKAMWRVGPGTIPVSNAKELAEAWLETDVIKIGEEKPQV